MPLIIFLVRVSSMSIQRRPLRRAKLSSNLGATVLAHLSGQLNLVPQKDRKEAMSETHKEPAPSRELRLLSATGFFIRKFFCPLLM